MSLVALGHCRFSKMTSWFKRSPTRATADNCCAPLSVHACPSLLPCMAKPRSLAVSTGRARQLLDGDTDHLLTRIDSDTFDRGCPWRTRALGRRWDPTSGMVSHSQRRVLPPIYYPRTLRLQLPCLPLSKHLYPVRRALQSRPASFCRRLPHAPIEIPLLRTGMAHSTTICECIIRYNHPFVINFKAEPRTEPVHSHFPPRRT